jgi:U3 small nucleolar RNA-associated protein 20
MSRTSFLARRLIIDRPSSHIVHLQTEWTRPVTSIFRFFAGVYDVLSELQAKQFSRHVLAPIYRVLDEEGDLANMEDAIGEFRPSSLILDDLRQLATEVRDFVQAKIGPTDFSQVWESLRKKVRETREGRREEKNRMVSHRWGVLIIGRSRPTSMGG